MRTGSTSSLACLEGSVPSYSPSSSIASVAASASNAAAISRWLVGRST